MATKPLKSITFPGIDNVYTVPQVDNTNTQAGAAAEAKKTGDDIDALRDDLAELEDNVNSAYIVDTETGSIASFTDGADDVPVKDLQVAIEPVQSGSEDPSPENVRPISGWTGANVTRTGKNLYEGVQEINTTPFDPALNYDVNVAETCTFQFTASSNYANSNNYWLVYLELKDGTKSYVTPTAGQTVSKVVYATSENPLKHIYVRSIGITAGNVYNLQLEKGSTATAYEPYQGETYEVDWTTEAGTVYGGTLDVTTGVLTVDRGFYTLTGSETWSAWDTNAYYSNCLSSSAVDTNDTVNCISSMMEGKTTEAIYSGTSGVGARSTRLYISATEYANIETFTGMQICYKLATPQTYQLTAHEVSTILGQNNIFADCGNVTAQYRADTKLYIDKVLSQA